MRKATQRGLGALGGLWSTASNGRKWDAVCVWHRKLARRILVGGRLRQGHGEDTALPYLTFDAESAALCFHQRLGNRQPQANSCIGLASRNKAFKDDNVLQENVIILLERDGRQNDVIISTSTDDSFSDLDQHKYSFDRVVYAGDPEIRIHIPTSHEKNTLEQLPAIRFSLEEIGVQVSTGPVVDFRLKQHLRKMPDHFSPHCPN